MTGRGRPDLVTLLRGPASDGVSRDGRRTRSNWLEVRRTGDASRVASLDEAPPPPPPPPPPRPPPWPDRIVGSFGRKRG